MRRIPALSAAALLMLTTFACGVDDDQDAGDQVSTTSPGATTAASASIAGAYHCGLPPEAPDVVEVREDGTVTITQPGASVEGTWRVEGDEGAFTIDGHEDPFSVEGERLLFDDGFVCTEAG